MAALKTSMWPRASGHPRGLPQGPRVGEPHEDAPEDDGNAKHMHELVATRRNECVYVCVSECVSVSVCVCVCVRV